ncbi:MAG: hypothetical protein WCK47_09160 [bacterium]
MRFIKYIIAVLFAVHVLSAQAAVVHISKSYPQGYQELTTSPYEFNASSPIYIDDCLAWGGYQGYSHNLIAGSSVALFEDSSTYSLVQDKALDPTQTYASINCDGFAAAGAGGLRVYALGGTAPTIDYTGTTHVWGGGACGFFITNVTTRTQEFRFEGLHIVCNNLSAPNWGDAFVMIGPGCNVPVFKDCVFELARSRACACGGGDIHIYAPAGPAFDHCGFRLTPATADNALMLKPAANYFHGDTVFSKCTFIVNPAAAPSHWSPGWGNERAAFDHCLFSYNDMPSRYGNVPSYNDNCDWPAMTGKPAGNGNITLDPQLVDAARSFRVAQASPCVRDNEPNIGYDQDTKRPVTTGTLVKVERLMGVPTLQADGLWMTIPGFSVYWPHWEYQRDFARAGTKFHDFPANEARCDYTRSLPTWTGTNPDKWDYSQLDQFFSAVLSQDPNALIMPRIYIGTPDWWLSANPAEMEVLDNGSTNYSGGGILPRNGPFPSLASAKWRQDMTYGLEHFLDYVNSKGYTKNIGGYKLAGLATDEWYHWSSGRDELAGYSTPTQNAFRAWLRTKYNNDVAALRAAWGNSSVTFETAATPTRNERRTGMGSRTFRDPATAMNVIDWYIFYNEIIPETQDYFAGVIKRKTGGSVPVGAFYAYMYEFMGNPEFGHNALERYLASPNLDFVYVTASYGSRDMATGGDYQRAPAMSVQLHGKLWYHDNDIATILTPGILQKLGLTPEQIAYECKRLGYTDTIDKNRMMLRRGAGFTLCNGIFEDFFDLHTGYYANSDLMAEVATLNNMFDNTRLYDRSSNSEILVVSDEVSCNYAPLNSQLVTTALYNPQIALIKMGAPADHVLVNDLGRVNPAQYKMAVFLNCYNLDDQQRLLIDAFKGGGRMLVWAYAPGYFNKRSTSTANMQSACGMTLQFSALESMAGTQVQIKPQYHPLGQILYNTGKTQFGPSGNIAKWIWAADAGGTILGSYPGTNYTSMAIKDMGTWKSIWTVTPDMPAAIYRELARYAGVHIYNERDDTFYANKSFACVHADGDGTRTLKLPKASSVYDMIASQKLSGSTTAYERSMGNGETIIFRLDNPDPSTVNNWRAF